MAKGLTLENVLKLVGAVGGAGFAGGMGSEGQMMDFMSGLLGTSGIPMEAGPKMVDNTYPRSEMSVTLLPGVKEYDNNQVTLQRFTAQEAARMQTLREHNAALTQFLKPGQTPQQRMEAVRKGREAERKLLSFWTDRRPRKNYSPSSSAVSQIRITPDNRVQVQWRTSPKWYDFLPASDPFEASLAFQQLVTAPSVGRAVMPVAIGMAARNNKKKPEQAGVEYSWWNARHYDASKA